MPSFSLTKYRIFIILDIVGIVYKDHLVEANHIV